MRILASLSWAALLAAGAFACSQESRVTSDTSDLVGGVDGQGFALDAIGTISATDNAGKATTLCNGTLITPTLVLTSKLCAIQDIVTPSAVDGGAPTTSKRVLLDVIKLTFNLGGMTTRAIAIDAVQMCAPETGGFDGSGCNLALYRLSTPVADVAPIPFGPKELTPDQIGTKLMVVGYGDQLQDGDLRGTRRIGNVTLRAVDGAPMKAIFATAQDLAAAYTTADGTTLTEPTPAMTAYYERQLLPSYEVYAGGAPGDVQLCLSDPGAPLLAPIEGRLTIVGVAGQTALGATKNKCLSWGNAFAVLGPGAQTFIAESLSAAANDPCGIVTTRGGCEGDVAVRCTRPVEGPRRITRNDCAAVLQHCIPPADAVGEVSCGD